MNERTPTDVKRFYIPSFDWTCPECGNAHTFNNYISYPWLDEPAEVYGMCEHEDTEFEREDYWEGIIAHATVRVDIEKVDHD